MIKLYTELLLATFFWGFGFVTAVWSLTAVGPLWLTGLRFLFAILMLDLFHRFRIFGLTPLRYTKKEWMAGFFPGLSLFAMLALQTWGLRYTSPTKSGFITVLYVLFVPLLEWSIFKVPMRKPLFLWILLALLGAALICQGITSQGISREFLSAFNFGDFLTFLCAIAAAAQFIFVNLKIKAVPSPVRFHIYQSAWVTLFSIVLAIPLEGFGFLQQQWSSLAWIGLIQLSFFSSAIAYLIQVRAQRTLSPSTVAIFMLLESPWAMLLSVMLLKENLTALQISGAVLILLAAAAETYSNPHSASARTSTG